MTAFIFPGQGSQKVGMGADLAEASAHAREVFQEVDEALKQKLSALMKDGPESELTMTANAQPAIMANSVATARVLEKEFGVTTIRRRSLSPATPRRSTARSKWRRITGSSAASSCPFRRRSTVR